MERPDIRPPVVLIVDDPETLVSFDGETYKAWTRKIQACGYEIRTWFSRATDCGAALWEGHLVTICRKIGHPLAAAILPQHLGTALPPRSCSNMLKPFGIPSTSWRHGAMTKTDDATFSNFVGYLNDQPVR
ncbi:MAG: hypothetical protein ACREBR_02675 [bacterium]